MKQIFVLMLCILTMSACGQQTNAEPAMEQRKQVNDYVEVIYFHGKQRCMTCRSIEKNVKDLLDAKFTQQMEQGKVVWRIIDISNRENAKLVEKYEVSWSSLFVVQHVDSKEMAEDLTEFAFNMSLKDADKFKSDLEAKINQILY